MADEKLTKGRKKLTFREIAEQHGAEIDSTDPQQRTRYRRILDKEYERGLSEKVYSQKSAEHYMSRVSGKPITPIEQTLNVVHKSVEESAASILEMIGQKRKEARQAEQPTKPQSIQ